MRLDHHRVKATLVHCGATLLLACMRLGLAPLATAIALATLLFGTPLPLYGAMVWEHTVAVALGFLGVVLLLALPRGAEVSRARAIRTRWSDASVAKGESTSSYLAPVTSAANSCTAPSPTQKT